MHSSKSTYVRGHCDADEGLNAATDGLLIAGTISTRYSPPILNNETPPPSEEDPFVKLIVHYVRVALVLLSTVVSSRHPLFAAAATDTDHPRWSRSRRCFASPGERRTS